MSRYNRTTRNTTEHNWPSEWPSDLFTFFVRKEILLTPWCKVLLEKLTGLQLVKKLPAFHGTRRFITALTSVRHLSLSWASPIQSIYLYPISWRSIHPNIIHPSTPRSPQWSLSIRFPHQEPTHPPLRNHTRHMPSPSHSSRFYRPHNIGRKRTSVRKYDYVQTSLSEKAFLIRSTILAQIIFSFLKISFHNDL